MKALKKQFKDLLSFPFDMVYQDLKQPNKELPDHYHDLYEIFYIHSGKGTVLINNAFYEIAQGDVYIVPKNVIHHTIPCTISPPTISALFFDASLIQDTKLDGSFSYLDVFTTVKERNEYKISLKLAHQDLVEDLLYKIFNETSEKSLGYQSAIVHWIHYILLALNRLMLEPQTYVSLELGPNWMKDTLNDIEENLNQPLTLSALAQKAFVSPEHFSRVFKTMTGMTFTQYFNLKKVMNAKEMLTNSDDNISTIAEKNGFHNIPHFYRVFKKHVGLTPSAYRRLNS